MDKLKYLIEECMDNVSMDDGVKVKILDVDVNGSIKNETAYDKRVTIRRICKNVASVAACLILLIVVTSAGTYALSGKSIFEVFFKDSEVGFARELLDYNGQSYTIDEYTITLEQTLYDSKTMIGYCVFAITKEGGKPEADLNPWNQATGNVYGKDGRFCIEQFANWTTKYEYIGDTLYQYISFSADDTFEHKIRLLDLDNYGEDGYFKYYEYTVKETSKVREYQINDTTNMTISPLGISIDCYSSLGDVSIILHYKNGDKDTVVDTKNDIGTASSSMREVDSFRMYQYVFENIKDVTEIECVELSGEKYYAK